MIKPQSIFIQIFSARVSQIEQSLDKGVRELTGFLEQVLGPAGQETVRKVAHDAMLQPI